MIDVYRKYGHRADLMVMFNCPSNNFNEDRMRIIIYSFYDDPKIRRINDSLSNKM